MVKKEGWGGSGDCSCDEGCGDKKGHTPTFRVTNFLLGNILCLRYNVMCYNIRSEHNDGVQEGAEKSPSLKNKV